MMNYVIVGDTKEYKGCLIYTVSGGLERAEQVLNRMLNNPNQQDIMEMKRHSNIRIEPVNETDAWWNR